MWYLEITKFDILIKHLSFTVSTFYRTPLFTFYCDTLGIVYLKARFSTYSIDHSAKLPCFRAIKIS